jgi:hypothetical protein
MARTRVSAATAVTLLAALCVALPLAGDAAGAGPVSLPAGARIGIVNLLDAEVTHYHAAKKLEDSFLKTLPVGWPMGAMLGEALAARLTQLGLTPVAVEPSEALREVRESCFLNANLGKALPKECRQPFAQFVVANHVDSILVLGPGLNNGEHAGGGRHKELPEYLRGWCVVSGAGAAGSAPSLLSFTELVLLRPDEKGAQLLARQWGGDEVQTWIGFPAAADPKALGSTQLEPARPLFQAMLTRQAQALLARVAAAR